MTPIPKNAVVTKLFAPKFHAECTDRELHSSHGDHFRDHFHVYVPRPKSCPKVFHELSKSCPYVARRLLQSAPEEMVTKVVPMRTVELSIGAFC